MGGGPNSVREHFTPSFSDFITKRAFLLLHAQFKVKAEYSMTSVHLFLLNDNQKPLVDMLAYESF